MSDNDLTIDVNAEGVEDAAGEFEDVSGAAAGDADGGAPGGGGGGSGRFGKILSRLLGLLAFLGPILQVLEVVSKVLTAFVAPLAILLLRLLTPALRLLLRALPLFFAFTDKLDQLLANFQGWVTAGARTAVNEGVRALIPNLAEFDPVAFAKRAGRAYRDVSMDIVDGLASRINDQLRRLPSDIGSAIASRLPNLGPLGGGGGDGGGGLFDRFNPFDRPGDSGGGDDGDPPIINLEGGLGAFVDGVTQNGSIDWP